MEYSRERLYTRFSFSALAEVLNDTGAVTRTRVTNVSYGGCRLLAQGQFPMGAKVTVTIQTPTDHFEATATVVYSTANVVGLMFGNIPKQSLLVLQKWIRAAMQEQEKPEAV
ncbi:MAG: hypothetical protein DMG37_23490 [Acidobacteria bacterium]|nr:MAG: hypothetical protein DMG37_23490 [Acidobacteriota bacterium]